MPPLGGGIVSPVSLNIASMSCEKNMLNSSWFGCFEGVGLAIRAE